MAELKQTLKTLKLNESNISVVLGAVVVLIVGILLLRWFNSRQGTITNQAANQSTGQQGSNANISGENGASSTYIVQAGDTLWKISQAKFQGSGYNWVDIAKANNLPNPNHIVAGQTLTIPSVPIRTPTASVQKPLVSPTITTSLYTTVKGDSLWKIAVAAYGNGYKWTTIYNANIQKIGRNPGLLYSGVVLSIPR